MFQIRPDVYIDVNFITTIRSEDSILMVKMADGEAFIVSPQVYTDIFNIKKSLDKNKTEQAY